MYSTAGQRDQGHVTVAGVSGRRQRLTGTCPSTGAAGRRSATNRCWRAGEEKRPSATTDSLAHHAYIQTAVVAMEPTGQDSRLGHHTARTHSCQRSLSSSQHPTILPWTGRFHGNIRLTATGHDRILSSTGRAEESDVTAALSSQLSSRFS